MTAIEEWMNRSQCREAIETTVVHVDAGDASAFAQLFTADGILVRPNGSLLEGRDAIQAAYAARPANRVTRHLVTNVIVTLLDTQRASARSSVLLWSSSATEGDPVHGRQADPRQLVGEFDDELARQSDGRWLLRRREARFVMYRDE